MNNSSIQHGRSNFPALPRGSLVSYEIPFADTLDLTGRLTGVVLTRAAFNQAVGRPCICPIIYGESSINEAWGIRIPVDSESPCYLRPDLSSYLCASYASVQPVLKKDGSGVARIPSTLTAAAFRRFIEIITPTQEKFLQKPQGFLGFGSIGWSDRVPRNHMDYDDTAPLLNLTPPELYSQTGRALVVRGYTHLENFDPRHCVAVGANKWFVTAFFPVTGICAVSIKGRMASRCGRYPILAGERVMKGFGKKAASPFDEQAYAEICRRYSGRIGTLPSFIRVSRQETLRS